MATPVSKRRKGSLVGVLILYDAPRCPYCARTRIVLAEKSVPHETVTIDLANRPDWLLERNPPHGRVPVLEEDGWVLPESAVIDEYLEDRYPEPALLPADHVARATARLQVFRFDDLGGPYYAFRRGEPDAGERLGEALSALDATLAGAPFLTGAAFGLADVAYLPWLLRLRDLMGVPLDSFPAVVRWLETCSERPSVAAEVRTVATLAA
jgi:glutathione S-transferase